MCVCVREYYQLNSIPSSSFDGEGWCVCVFTKKQKIFHGHYIIVMRIPISFPYRAESIRQDINKIRKTNTKH